MKIHLTDKDGYEAVSDIIKEWAEKNQPYVYCEYIVDIQTPNGRNMQYVEYDISDDCWIWQKDWWEGEDSIELFGRSVCLSCDTDGTDDFIIDTYIIPWLSNLRYKAYRNHGDAGHDGSYNSLVIQW